MKKLLAASIFGLIILSGCQNDDEKNVDLTTEEASAAINSAADQLGDDIISIVESEGLNALMDLSILMEGSDVIGGRMSEGAWTKERVNLMIQYFVNGPAARTNNDDPTSFDDIKGLYEWNPELQDFEKEESEFFIVKFPAAGSETNNAELKISDLQFVTVTDTDDDFVSEYEIPSVIIGYLKIDGETLVELDFEVNWSSTGDPEKADITLFISPFTFDLNFDDTFEKSSSLLASVSIDNEPIVGIDLDVEYESADKEEPLLLEGFVQYRGIKILGSIDMREVGPSGNPNDYFDLALYADDSKVGDIVFVLEEDDNGSDDYVPYVQYADGTQENLEEILAPVFEEIESILSEFED
ncbi:MAG: hypothetical protein RLN88_02760 [Ekhidna sp.]|uniref:hypothetical protein n=1 Tax=Ekhidna sp. TaxID=2608089 RepID=UPI0032EB55A6